MPKTLIAAEVTEQDLVNCFVTRGHGDGAVTLYYAGEEEQVPLEPYTPAIESF